MFFFNNIALVTIAFSIIGVLLVEAKINSNSLSAQISQR